MSQELKELVLLSKNLCPQFKRLFEGFEKLEQDTNRYLLSSEELYQFKILYKAADKAGDIINLLEQMIKPTLYEGRLEKNKNGRYEVEGYELSSGSSVEVWIEDEEDTDYPGHFVPSRVEHNGKDYYVVALGRETNIQGVLVRKK